MSWCLEFSRRIQKQKQTLRSTESMSHLGKVQASYQISCSDEG